MSRSGTTHHHSTKCPDPFSNIVTHHAEDGSGIGSAIIAGEYSTSIHAECILTTNPSDDEEEKDGRTVPELLIEKTNFPPEVTGHPLPQRLCVESMPISVSDLCVKTFEPRFYGSHACPSSVFSRLLKLPGEISDIQDESARSTHLLHLIIFSLCDGGTN